MGKRCYIVGAGDFFGIQKPRECDLVIAADGGYTPLVESGIMPNLLIGDLDSLGKNPSGVETLRFPQEKDDTDMRLAYLEGKRRGYTEFLIYGGTGGREDHTFANYCLLYEIARDGNAACLYGRSSKAYVIVNSSTRGTGKEEKYISVFAFMGDAFGVNIKGLKYELSDAVLSAHYPLGASNRTVGRDYEISVGDGALLIIEEL